MASLLALWRYQRLPSSINPRFTSLWGKTTGTFRFISDLAENTFCVIVTSASYEWVFSINEHAGNSRRADLKSTSVNDILSINSALWKKLTRFHIFPFQCFLRPFRLLWNEPLNKLPLEMKRVAWVFSGFQTHSGRCRFGTEILWGGAGAV